MNRRLFLAGALTALFNSSLVYGKKSDLVVGWIEHACLYPENLVLKAKVDTGADNSSLNAPNREYFEKDGTKWVRFTVTNTEGREITFEREIIKTTRIKTRCKKGSERPVIRMGICVGTICREVELNLVDRSRFKYQLLIGRSFMKSDLLVDPGKRYTIEPVCSGVTGSE
jgi:hypothetical protein